MNAQRTPLVRRGIARLRLPGVLLLAITAFPLRTPQTTRDPFPSPIPLTAAAVVVNVSEFAAIPAFGGRPARMMLLLHEPGTRQWSSMT